MASFVVFLVALPLCMGIALASGAPPALGLVTGIIGGLVVGFIAGQPLQVSGPAAGLAVMVWELIQDFGLAALGLAVLICGVVQLAAGAAGLGRWFRAVSPAVIQGMLSGIGVLIIASQFHMMVDDAPRSSAVDNLLSIPESVYLGLFAGPDTVHHLAAAVGVSTILIIVLWNRFRPRQLRMLPGPLIGVVAATAGAGLLALPIARVEVPSDLLSVLNWTSAENLSLLSVPAFWASAVGLALIASAETLLCATATDRMHDGERTKYNKELRAQGIGNMLCGVVGALPMTGVIVRSSANIEAGAKTKWSGDFSRRVDPAVGRRPAAGAFAHPHVELGGHLGLHRLEATGFSGGATSGQQGARRAGNLGGHCRNDRSDRPTHWRGYWFGPGGRALALRTCKAQGQRRERRQALRFNAARRRHVYQPAEAG